MPTKRPYYLYPPPIHPALYNQRCKKPMSDIFLKAGLVNFYTKSSIVPHCSSCHVTRLIRVTTPTIMHTSCFVSGGEKWWRKSRAFKRERNETCVISTVRTSLPPQGLLSSTQETNLLNTPLMACQKGVKKKNPEEVGRRRRRRRRVVVVGKKRCLRLCAQSHLPMRTLSHSRIPHLQLVGRGA